ncbi:hypothetical protein [Asticcacaulis sp. AC466]|uniref:hypothetical protein n=1 Tax=Asticcacaulis sp. AC466 TaxID=1282362 RepID=UPI0004266986|nr:hypothetical protein [Asticcacaulis sp. AC466]
MTHKKGTDILVIWKIHPGDAAELAGLKTLARLLGRQMAREYLNSTAGHPKP